MPTWARLHGEVTTIELDGDAHREPEWDASDAQAQAEAARDQAQTRARRRKRLFGRAKVLDIGPDGRKVYTKDFDARAGYRTATGKNSGSLYVGRELHIGVAVPAIASTDRHSKITFTDPCPQVIIFGRLTPAGTHRAKSVLPSILEAGLHGLAAEVVCDAGYSLSKPEFLHLPLQQAGIDLTMRPVTHQLGERPGIKDARIVDGQLFSAHLPHRFVGLTPPNPSTPADRREEIIADYNHRARYRYGRIANPGDGTMRWMCPFCSGKLRSRQLPTTMRRSAQTPLVALPATATSCCEGTITTGAGDLPHHQPTLFGTPAWWQAYGRRNLTETINSLLKGGFTTIESSYCRMLNSVKITMAVAHTLAGVNRHIIREWRRQHRRRSGSPPPRPRRARSNRLPRWDDLDLPTGARGPNPPI
jgi:hypothetical protein